VTPVYPKEAKEARVQGVVALSATIGKDGKIVALKVESGPSELRQAALDAVQQWEYRPYLLNGQPVEVATTIEVNFRLN
jgi:protein TonB